MEGSGDKPLPEEKAAKGGNKKKIAVVACHHSDRCRCSCCSRLDWGKFTLNRRPRSLWHRK